MQLQRKSKEVSKSLQNGRMIKKCLLVGCVDFVAKEVKYHGPCRVKYQKEAEFIRGSNKKDKGFWHRERERYKECFDALANHINDSVIVEKQVFLLSDLLQMYQSLIRDESEEFKEATPATTHLVEKITKHFGDQLT